jgi:hypothetical protein
MKKLDAGADYIRYAMGELTVIALRDGYVDMPPSRLRQSGDRPFGSDLPAQVELINGKLRLSVNAFLVIDPWGRRQTYASELPSFKTAWRRASPGVRPRRIFSPVCNSMWLSSSCLRTGSR